MITDENKTAEERLRDIEEERRVLKTHLASQRRERLKQSKEQRIIRDKKIDQTLFTLGGIRRMSLIYRKYNKAEKEQCDILSQIKDHITEAQEKIRKRD